MDDLILFFLLEQPRTVSDMIAELTEKRLSGNAEERSDQIPRIAGNWFKEGTGVLWQLQDTGKINDAGRGYALDREWFVDAFVDDLALQACFPDHGERGDDATVNDAYASFMPNYTLGEIRYRLRKEVFQGDTMADMFAFDAWQDALLADQDTDRGVWKHGLVYDFWPSVHLMVISSILSSRFEVLADLMDENDEYFRWRNRRETLQDTRDAFVDTIGKRWFGASRDVDGSFDDVQVAALDEAFGHVDAELRDEQLELLTHVYLLGMQDGVGLFQQYAKYDHNVNLLFNLLERGWMIEERTVERHPRTGNIVIPLGEVRSYLDDLAGLVER